jgi:hypothetical protein
LPDEDYDAWETKSAAPPLGRSRSPDARAKRPVGWLFTWNGPWLQDLPQLQAGWPPRCDEAADALAAAVMQTAEAESLLAEAWAALRAADCCEGFPLRTAALEISCHSEAPRVHLHAYVSVSQAPLDSQGRSRKVIAAEPTFRGEKPSHRVSTTAGRGGNKNARAIRQGHFYLQCRKKGNCGHKTNFRMHHDFVVEAKFVKALFQQRKMSLSSAALEFAAARDNSAEWIIKLRKAAALEAGMAAEGLWKEAQAQWQARPFKPAVADELAFLKQFLWRYLTDPGWGDTAAACAVEAVIHRGSADGLKQQRRYKFLVYEGPSQLGKTERAAHWFGTLQTLVVNAQNTTTPSLRQLHAGTNYKAIVYDEGDWRLPAAQRALFQSPPRPVTMAQSNCNEATYDCSVFATPMIICSNGFWKGSEGGEERLWVALNSYIVKVTEATWIEEPEKPGAS